jgi:SAM-dependent methyltransferase
MVREARLTGARLQPTPWFAQADAQALPFKQGTFDRVLCAGVLYHVRDCERALREMRRVLRPGGRAVISTNGAYAMRRIYELHAAAARELGYDPMPISAGHFTMDDLPMVQRIFPAAERHILEGALVFDAAEPALSFYASNRIDALRDLPSDASHRPRLLTAMRDQIEAIIAREGVFTVPKSVGYFVAAADPSGP